MDRKDYIKSLKITGVTLFIISTFWFLFSIQTSFGYSGTGTTQDLKSGSRFNGDLLAQPFNGSVTIFFGTQSTSPIGTGTAGYMGTNTTGLPKLKYSYIGGSSTITLDGFTHVAINGSDIPLSGSVSAKLDAIGGVGTSNTLNSPTLAGQGTITATFNANGLDITPAEYATVNNASSELQAQINNKQATLVNNSPGTVTNVLGYTPPANVLGSITTALGYTPPANVLGSITSALGYTPPANTSGSITTALGYTPTNLGNTIELGTETTGNTNNITEGSTNRYYTDARVNAAVGSTSVGSRLNEQITSVADGHHFVYDAALGKWKNATSTAAIGFDGITGVPSDNTQLAKFLGVDRLLLPGTTTALTGTGSTQRLYSLVRTNQAGTATPTSIADSSGGTRTVTIKGNVTTTTAGSKFAGGMSFNAGASSCSLADAAVWTPAGDFFCRFWWSPLNTTNAASLTGHYATDGGFRVMFNPSDNTGIQLYIQANGGGTIVNISEGSDTNWATGTARFVEVSRSGNNYFLFVGGTIVGSTTTATAWFNPTNAFHVGGDGDWGDPSANGTMDDFIWNDGAAGHTSNYTPPTVPEGDSLPAGTDLYLKFDDTSAFANYTYYTFQIIPPGTTAAFVNIVDDGTQSSKVEMVLGSTTPYSSATVHVLQGITASRTLFGFYDAYCLAEYKDIIETGASVQNEAYAIAKKVNIVKSHPVIPINKVTLAQAEFAAQEDYMNLFITSDIEAYKNIHIAEYTTAVAGSVSVNLTKLNSDAQSYHEMQRKAEFEVLPDKNERIKKKKKAMESDKGITSISVIADDPSTDDLLKGGDSRTVSMGNQLGVLFGAFQAQQREIGSLTAALENLRVLNNLK